MVKPKGVEAMTVGEAARELGRSPVTRKRALGVNEWFRVTEAGSMAYRWPEDTDFALRELDALDRNCPACGVNI